VRGAFLVAPLNLLKNFLLAPLPGYWGSVNREQAGQEDQK